MPFGWESLPWQVFNPQSHDELPTFFLAELSAAIVLLLGILHAAVRKDMPHLKLLACSLLGGVGNDVFFTWLPLVDNFFHSQATVMLGPRIPLYIIMYYVGWLYFPTALAWSLRLRPTAEACAAGLLCALFYWPWDMTGAKHLWWTWHTTDQTLENRFLGVPLASSHWTMIFCAVWARLLRHTVGYRGDKTAQPRDSFLKSCAIILAFSVPLMMGAIGVVNCIFTFTAGMPEVGTTASVVGTIGVFFAVVWCDYFDQSHREQRKIKRLQLKNRKPRADSLNDDATVADIIFYVFGISLHLAMCYYVVHNGNSVAHVSTGIHQTFGPCGMEVIDITGASRHEYVCAEEHAEFEDSAWTFDCPAANNPVPPTEMERWYTICGTQKSATWVEAVSKYIIRTELGFLLVAGFALQRVVSLQRLKSGVA